MMQRKDEPVKGLKEKLYDKINVSVRALDWMITVLIIITAVVVYIGTR